MENLHLCTSFKLLILYAGRTCTMSGICSYITRHLVNHCQDQPVAVYRVGHHDFGFRFSFVVMVAMLLLSLTLDCRFSKTRSRTVCSWQPVVRLLYPYFLQRSASCRQYSCSCRKQVNLERNKMEKRAEQGENPKMEKNRKAKE